MRCLKNEISSLYEQVGKLMKHSQGCLREARNYKNATKKVLATVLLKKIDQAMKKIVKSFF